MDWGLIGEIGELVAVAPPCPSVDWDRVGEIGELVGLLLGLLGLVFGLYNYRRSVKTRRAEWLYTFFSTFYEDDHYKSTRRLLDYGDETALRELYAALRRGDPERSEPVVDYLNFFEFIAGLWMLKELSEKEIRQLFEYYLQLIQRRPGVHEFVRDPANGFENLDRLLSQVGTSDA